jgi:hypothetical protein
MTEIKLTNLQQIALDLIVERGSRVFSGHDRRQADALVRKGLAAATPLQCNPKAATFAPTELGRQNTTRARAIARLRARAASKLEGGL